VLSSPKLYRAAIKSANKAVSTLPRVVLYNPLNEWGKQREVPEAPTETFRDWYLKRNKK
jgi:L-lactate dehydrogenase complex protein LldF